MLDEFRSTSITWDKANRKVYEPLRASAGDNKGRKLSVQVVNGGVIEDLSGASLSLFWETKDKAQKGLDAFTAVDATKGEFEIYYTTGMLSNEGTLNANLVFVDTTGRIVSEPFTITVFQGLDDDAIQSSDSFTALTEALAQVGTINNKADRAELLALESTFEQNKVSVEQQLVDKASRDAIWGMSNLGQDVKDAMTGGSVAVVGIDVILEENVVNKQITPSKIATLQRADGSNLASPFNWLTNTGLTDNGTVVSRQDRQLTNFYPVTAGQSYTTFGYPVARVAFYNQSKTFQVILASNLSNNGGQFTPTSDGFVRIEVTPVANRQFLLIETNKFKGVWVPYRTVDNHLLVESHNMGVEAVGKTNLKNGSILPRHLSEVELSKNLLNTENITPNKFFNSSGAIVDFPNYFVSEKITSSQSQKITVQRGRGYNVYNEFGTLITNHLTSSNDATVTFDVPAGGSFQVSTSMANLYTMMVNVGAQPLAFEPYGYRMKGLIVETEGDKLRGKKVANLGDSIAAGSTAGVVSYAHLLAKNDYVNLASYAADGATITQSANSIISQVNSLIAQHDGVDVILLNGLTNDINRVDLYPLGDISTSYDSELDTATFSGAFEHICKTLRLKYLNAVIVYVRVHKMDSRNLDHQKIYGNRAKEICEKWSIPVIDLFEEGGLNTFIPQMKQVYTLTTVNPLGDGTHPNKPGYEKFYYPPVKAKILSLI